MHGGRNGSVSIVCSIRQAPRPFRAEVEYRWYTTARGMALERAALLRVADKHRRLCIGEKVGDLGFRVRRVEWKEHATCAHCAEIKHECGDGLLDLRCNTVSGRETGGEKNGSDTVRAAREIGVAVLRAVWRLGEQGIRPKSCKKMIGKMITVRHQPNKFL